MSEHSSLPRLSIATLGGTVSMRLGAVGDGVTPSLDCERQLLQVPQLREMAQLNVASLCLVPSASLDFATLLDVLAECGRALGHPYAIDPGLDDARNEASRHCVAVRNGAILGAVTNDS